MSAEVPEYVEGNREEKAAIIRRFILNAAPGELPQVLRALKTLTRDDDLFFEVVPGFCNEYSMRQQVVYTHAANSKSANALCRTGFNLMTTKHNHLPNLVRRYAKVTSGATKGEASQAVMEYLEQEGTSIVGLLAGADEAHPEPEDEVFDNIHQVFVTTAELDDGNDGQKKRDGVIVAEVDVVEGHILRGHLITAEDAAALPPALKYIVDLLLPSSSSSGGAESSSVSKAQLRQELQTAMSKYVAKAFCATATAAVAVAANSKLHPQEAGATAATLVFPATLPSDEAEGGGSDDAIVFAVSVSSRHTNLRALWTGRWKSVYMVTLSPPSSSGGGGDGVGEWGCDVVGEAKAHVHYFEEGNVHMESTRVVPKQSVTIVVKDPAAAAGEGVEAQVAKKVAKQLKKEESAYEGELQEACRCGSGSVGDEAIKGLRRKLPISRQLFDFSVDPTSHGNRSWSRPDQ